MSHLKRLSAPRFWNLAKKKGKWVVTPRLGPHTKQFSIPLSIVLTSILKIAETTAEAKKIIRKGEIFVDGKRRKDYAYPVGLFDVVSIPKLNKNYRVIPTSHGLELIEIKKEEAKLKIFKIQNKTILKNGKLQLNLHDGKNILVENDSYKTGDSLLVELPTLKIIEYLPLQTGNIGIVSKGSAAGKIVKIKNILKGSAREKPRLVCEIEKESKTITKDSVIIIGREKPVIKVS